MDIHSAGYLGAEMLERLINVHHDISRRPVFYTMGRPKRCENTSSQKHLFE